MDDESAIQTTTTSGPALSSEEPTAGTDFNDIMSAAVGGDDGSTLPADPPETTTEPGAVAQPAPGFPKTARDYTGLDQEEIPLFKAMSNEAYARLRPIYDEYKGLKPKMTTLEQQLAASKNSQLFEHEQAFTLSQEYQATNRALEDLNFEARYWQDQLKNAEAGRPVQFLVNKTEDGKYEASEPIEITDENRGEVRAQLLAGFAKATQYQTTMSERLAALKTSHASNWKNFTSQLGEVDKMVFGKLDTNHPAVKASIESWTSKFPAEVRHQPVYQMLAKSITVIQGLIRQLNTKAGRSAIASTAQETARNGGPGAGRSTGNGTVDLAAEDARWNIPTYK